MLCAVYVSCIWCAVSWNLYALHHTCYVFCPAVQLRCTQHPLDAHQKETRNAFACQALQTAVWRATKKLTVVFGTVGHIEATLSERFGAFGSLFMPSMCIDAPETTTNSLSSGFSRRGCPHYPCFDKRIERSFIRIFRLVDTFSPSPMLLCGSIFLVAKFCLVFFPQMWLRS